MCLFQKAKTYFFKKLDVTPQINVSDENNTPILDCVVWLYKRSEKKPLFDICLN